MRLLYVFSLVFLSGFVSGFFEVNAQDSNPEQNLCTIYQRTPPIGTEQSKYSGEIKACITKDPATRSEIEDYICIPGVSQAAAYQVVLDKVFQKIDNDLEQEITTLAQEKSKSPFERIDTLQGKLGSTGIYASRYSIACSCIIPQELTRHFGEITTADWTEKFLAGSVSCEGLAKQKLSSYKAAGKLMIQREVVDEYQKSTREFSQPFFEQYTKLVTEVLRALIGGLNNIFRSFNGCLEKVIQ